MTQVNRPDLQERIRVGMRISEPYQISLGGGISPVVIVEDLANAGCNQGFPKRCWGRANVGAGGAGTNAQCVLEGSGDRGIVYRADRALIVKPAIGDVDIRVGQSIAGLTPSTELAFADTRDAGGPDAVCGTSTPLTAAIDGTRVARIVIAVVESILVDLNFILGSGSFLNFVSNTTNENLQVTFQWTEFLVENR